MEGETCSEKAIFVVGAGYRLPGDIARDEDLWAALTGNQGSPTLGSPPESRWGSLRKRSAELDTLLREAEAQEDCFHGGWVRHGCTAWEPQRFSITAREAPSIRPNTRLVLEATSDALQDAGLRPCDVEGTNTAVFVGAKPEDHWDRLLACEAPCKPASTYDRFYITGAAHSTSSARVADWLGTTGPVGTIDAACASGAMALQQAILHLQAGRCDMAIVAGVTTHLWPGPLLALAAAKMRSTCSTGACEVLSEHSQGYVPSEGCVAIIVTKNSVAHQRGLRTRLQLLEMRTMHNGRNLNGLVAPSQAAQEKLVRQVLKSAGLTITDIDLVELHGTGTHAGDSAEVNAVLNLMEAEPNRGSALHFNSAKTVFGHTEEASGLLGLLTVMLSFEKRAIAPFRFPESMNRSISQDIREFLCAQTTRIMSKQPTGLINSFGAFGAITTLLVRAGPLRTVQGPRFHASTEFMPPLCFSASSHTAMSRQVEIFQKQASKLDFAQAALQSALRREHFAYRACMFADGETVGLTKPSTPSSGSLRLIFVFSGQGFAYLSPARTAYKQHHVFRRHIAECEVELSTMSQLSLQDILSSEDDLSWNELSGELAQLVACVFCTGMLEVLRHWGLIPLVVIGHSLGALAASYAADGLSLREMLQLAAIRGRATDVAPSGRMLALKAARERVEDLILVTGCQANISNYNSPSSYVVSGDGLEEIQTIATKEGIASRWLKTAHSFHSHHMEQSAAYLRDELTRIKWASTERSNVQSKCIFVSDLTGNEEPITICRDIRYWTHHLTSPVLFESAVLSRKCDQQHVFIEIGPGDALAKLILQTDLLAQVTSVNEREGAAMLAYLHCKGHPVNWANVWNTQDEMEETLAFPPTPFTRREYWPTATAPSDDASWLSLQCQNDTVDLVSNARLGRILQQHRIWGAITIPVAM